MSGCVRNGRVLACPQGSKALPRHGGGAGGAAEQHRACHAVPTATASVELEEKGAAGKRRVRAKEGSEGEQSDMMHTARLQRFDGI